MGYRLAPFSSSSPWVQRARTARLAQVRDSLENTLQDSFDELDDNLWVVRLHAHDDTAWDSYLDTLHGYIQPRAQGSPPLPQHQLLCEQAAVRYANDYAPDFPHFLEKIPTHSV